MKAFADVYVNGYYRSNGTVHTLIHITEMIQTTPPLTIGHHGEIQIHIQDKKFIK